VCPGSWRPVSATAILLASRVAGPNRGPMATTASGRSRASAAIAAGSARGSVPVTPITAAPAACAVAVTAAIEAFGLTDLVTRTATRLSGAGGCVAGSAAARPTTCTPGSRAASSFGQAAGRPTASTATGWRARADAATWARAVAVTAEASSTGACAARASASAAWSTRPAVPATTTTGALVNSVRANAAVSGPGAVSVRTESAAAGARVATAARSAIPDRSVAAAVAGLP
jgi:hypothetical protein